MAHLARELQIDRTRRATRRLNYYTAQQLSRSAETQVSGNQYRTTRREGGGAQIGRWAELAVHLNKLVDSKSMTRQERSVETTKRTQLPVTVRRLDNSPTSQ